MATAVFLSLPLTLFGLRTQWKFQRKGRSLSYGAVDLDLSVVRFDDGLDITETETEAFYIVKITGMGAIKLLKNATLRFLRHPDAVVFDADDEVAGIALRTDAD